MIAVHQQALLRLWARLSGVSQSNVAAQWQHLLTEAERLEYLRKAALDLDPEASPVALP